MRSGYIKPKRYIVWSTDKEINLDDPFQKKMIYTAGFNIWKDRRHYGARLGRGQEAFT